MEKINLNNYEAYFLDYLEGNLSEKEQNDLAVFLNLHPELKAEMEEDFGEVTLVPVEAPFEQKEELKVDEDQLFIHLDNVDDFIISDLEGLLTNSQKVQLAAFIHENQLENRVIAYKATVLKANTQEIFKDKNVLKSEAIRLLTSGITAANVEDYIIASVEGELSEEETAALTAYVQKQELMATYQAYQSTILKADLSEVYADKASLKKRTGFIIPLYARVAGVAAAGLVLFGLAWNWNGGTVDNGSNGETETLLSEEVYENEGDSETVNDENASFEEGLNETDADEEVNPQPRNIQPYVPNKEDNQMAFTEDPKEDLISPKEDDSVTVQPLPNEHNEIEDNVVDITPGQESSDSLSVPPAPEKGTILTQDDVAIANSRSVKTDQPLKILTDRVGDAIDKEVFFSRDKDVKSDEYIAYHVKVGKFEFQRKKAK